ncbi:E3 ubiquitin/ISG15 ligase TRIM25-like [Gastrophryne carolinensis]
MPSDLGEELSCSICLDRYTDPVTLQCGHSFCKSCIQSALDTQEECRNYTCPECRAEYPERPPLERNRKLCNIVECYRMTCPKQEKNMVSCTYCDSEEPAVGLCLQCETSLCTKHLGNHNKSVDHFLIDPKTSLKSMTCPTHNKMLKYYCLEDDSCICVTCFAAGEHRGHLVQAIHEAFEKKQEQMQQVLDTLTSEKARLEKSLLRMRDHIEETQENATNLTKRVRNLCEDLREQINLLEECVLGEVTRQSEKIKEQASDLVRHTEINLEELSWNINHIQDLSSNTDPFCILQDQRSDLETVPGEGHSLVIGDLNEGLVSDLLHKHLYDIVSGLWNRMHLGDVLPLAMDANTAHNKMEISSDLKTVADSETNHGRPESPLRFSIYNQVLSTNIFTKGQHYLEVETSTSGIWDVGMAYPSIERDGKQSGIGDNDRSWCLRKYTKKYMAAYNSKAQSLLHEQCSQVIGIYLDYEAGQLSFYELCDPDNHLYRHIHTFTAVFQESLHAAVYVDDGAWVSFKSYHKEQSTL